MPALLADSLADLELLSKHLEIGVGKLELWNSFNKQATNALPTDVPQSSEEVGQALEVVTEQMEKAPTYFDPELPRTFKFLTESVRDPGLASKTIVFGAVRSLENLLIGVSQRLIRSLQKSADNVEAAITSKATIVIAGFLVIGGTRLLALLPGAWSWLKAVLDLGTSLIGRG